MICRDDLLWETVISLVLFCANDASNYETGHFTHKKILQKFKVLNWKFMRKYFIIGIVYGLDVVVVVIILWLYL